MHWEGEPFGYWVEYERDWVVSEVNWDLEQEFLWAKTGQDRIEKHVEKEWTLVVQAKPRTKVNWSTRKELERYWTSKPGTKYRERGEQKVRWDPRLPLALHQVLKLDDQLAN